MTRAVIADDEPLMREQLRERLSELWPGLEIVGEAKNGAEAVQMVSDHRPEVVFLDIRMPAKSGIEAAREIAQMSTALEGRVPEMVFVTAYDQYAVSAFEQGAVDYVMKPLSGARIATAVQRVKERLKAAPANLNRLLDHLADPPRRSGPFLRWINASHGEDVQLITIEEVKYFQSDTKYTRVVAARREGLIRKSIKELVAELDPSTFWQMHRATIVNLNAVESVGRDLNGHVVLRLKERPEVLQVSQPYAHLFRQM